MSLGSLFHFDRHQLTREIDARTMLVQMQRPLQRVLAVTGRSIDDVVNDPLVKREVLGFYKLHKWIQRASEVSDLERQWGV